MLELGMLTWGNRWDTELHLVLSAQNGMEVKKGAMVCLLGWQYQPKQLRESHLSSIKSSFLFGLVFLFSSWWWWLEKCQMYMCWAKKASPGIFLSQDYISWRALQWRQEVAKRKKLEGKNRRKGEAQKDGTVGCSHHKCHPVIPMIDQPISFRCVWWILA